MQCRLAFQGNRVKHNGDAGFSVSQILGKENIYNQFPL